MGGIVLELNVRGPNRLVLLPGKKLDTTKIATGGGLEEIVRVEK